MPNRYAKKVDRNQPQMVEELRQCGFVVHVASYCPDLGYDIVVIKQHRCLLVEVKPPGKYRLTASEQKMADHQLINWTVAQSAEDVINHPVWRS